MSRTTDLMGFLRKARGRSSASMSVVQKLRGQGRPDIVTASEDEIAALEKYHQLSDQEKLNLIFSTRKTQAFSMMLNVSENPYSVYRDLVDMGRAGIVASYLDIVTNDSTKVSPVHHSRVWVEKTVFEGKDYTKDIEELFEDLGVEDRIWQWVYEMGHFGDKYLKPAISSGKGIISLRDDFTPVDVLRVEFDGKLGAFVYVDPDFNLSSQPMYGFGGMEFQESSVAGPDSFVHMMINNRSVVSRVVLTIPVEDIERAAEQDEEDSWKPRFAKAMKEARSRTAGILEKEFARSADNPAKLLESLSFFGASLSNGLDRPFVAMEDARVVVATRRGWSLLMNSRRDYRVLNMADQAAALARFARAPQMRVFYVDTSGASVTERDQMVVELEDRVNRSISFNADTQLYQSQYSPSGFTDDLILPYSGARGDIRVEAIGGDVNVRDMADLDYFLGRWFAAVHMPKAFMGFEEMLPGFNSDKSLDALDVRYSSVTNKVQASAVRALKRLAYIHLKYKYGVEVPLKDINVKMQRGSTVEEAENLENAGKQLDIIERKLSFVETAGGDVTEAARDMLVGSGIFDNDQFEKWVKMKVKK